MSTLRTNPLLEPVTCPRRGGTDVSIRERESETTDGGHAWAAINLQCNAGCFSYDDAEEFQVCVHREDGTLVVGLDWSERG